MTKKDLPDKEQILSAENLYHSPMDEAALIPFNQINFYREHFMDATLWRPYVAEVCRRHNLTPCEDIRGGLAGSFPTFIVEERWVVKFFGQLFGGEPCYDTELEALRIAGQARLGSIPNVLASGELFPIPQDWPWPYFVMQLIRGVSIGEVYAQVSLADKLSMAQQMAEIARRLHGIPLTGSTFFKADWADFRRFLEQQRNNLAVNHAEWQALPQHLRAQVEDYVLPVDELVEAHTPPHLIHADLTADHLLGELIGGRWQTNGLIDFGDVRVGNLLYELQALHLDLFKGDRRLLQVFLNAYGSPEWQRHALPRQAMSMALLHQFDVLGAYRDRLERFATLEQAADDLWDVNRIDD